MKSATVVFPIEPTHNQADIKSFGDAMRILQDRMHEQLMNSFLSLGKGPNVSATAKGLYFTKSDLHSLVSLLEEASKHFTPTDGKSSLFATSILLEFQYYIDDIKSEIDRYDNTVSQGQGAEGKSQAAVDGITLGANYYEWSKIIIGLLGSHEKGLSRELEQSHNGPHDIDNLRNFHAVHDVWKMKAPLLLELLIRCHKLELLKGNASLIGAVDSILQLQSPQGDDVQSILATVHYARSTLLLTDAKSFHQAFSCASVSIARMIDHDRMPRIASELYAQLGKTTLGREIIANENIFTTIVKASNDWSGGLTLDIFRVLQGQSPLQEVLTAARSLQGANEDQVRQCLSAAMLDLSGQTPQWGKHVPPPYMIHFLKQYVDYCKSIVSQHASGQLNDKRWIVNRLRLLCRYDQIVAPVGLTIDESNDESKRKRDFCNAMCKLDDNIAELAVNPEVISVLGIKAVVGFNYAPEIFLMPLKEIYQIDNHNNVHKQPNYLADLDRLLEPMVMLIVAACDPSKADPHDLSGLNKELIDSMKISGNTTVDALLDAIKLKTTELVDRASSDSSAQKTSAPACPGQKGSQCLVAPAATPTMFRRDKTAASQSGGGISSCTPARQQPPARRQ